MSDQIILEQLLATNQAIRACEIAENTISTLLSRDWWKDYAVIEIDLRVRSEMLEIVDERNNLQKQKDALLERLDVEEVAGAYVDKAVRPFLIFE